MLQDDKSNIDKDTPGFARTMNPYTDKELIVAIPYMVSVVQHDGGGGR